MKSEVYIVAIIFFSFVAFIKVLSDNMVRRKLIDKGMLDENVKYLYSNTVGNPPASLKWGLALIALGAAILVGQFMPYSLRDEVTISLIFIFPGLALIAYYFIARKSNNDNV